MQQERKEIRVGLSNDQAELLVKMVNRNLPEHEQFENDAVGLVEGQHPDQALWFLNAVRDFGRMHDRNPGIAVPGDMVGKNEDPIPFEDPGYTDYKSTIQTAHDTNVRIHFFVDHDNRPAGGNAAVRVGKGRDSKEVMFINFQDGPIGETGRNGGFVEDLLVVCLERLRWYQRGKFACKENAFAIRGMVHTLYWLNERTRERRARAVEGTHQL